MRIFSISKKKKKITHYSSKNWNIPNGPNISSRGSTKGDSFHQIQKLLTYTGSPELGIPRLNTTQKLHDSLGHIPIAIDLLVSFIPRHGYSGFPKLEKYHFTYLLQVTRSFLHITQSPIVAIRSGYSCFDWYRQNLNHPQKEPP